MKLNKLLVVDTETGGLKHKTHSLLSISMAVVDFESKGVIDRCTWNIKHNEYVVTPEALAVNKIDLVEHHNNAMDAIEVANDIINFLQLHFTQKDRAVMFGQNVKFDKDFIETFFEQIDVEYLSCAYSKLVSHRFFDLMSVSIFLNLAGIIDTDGLRLEDMLQYLGIQVDERDRHTAEGDVNSTIDVLNEFLDLVK